jgi:hypothetical protein
MGDGDIPDEKPPLGPTGLGIDLDLDNFGTMANSAGDDAERSKAASHALAEAAKSISGSQNDFHNE